MKSNIYSYIKLKLKIFRIFFLSLTTIFSVSCVFIAIASDDNLCFLSDKKQKVNNIKCFFQCSNNIKSITFDNKDRCPEEIIISESKSVLSKKLKVTPTFDFGFSSLGGSNVSINLDFKKIR